MEVMSVAGLVHEGSVNGYRSVARKKSDWRQLYLLNRYEGMAQICTPPQKEKFKVFEAVSDTRWPKRYT